MKFALVTLASALLLSACSFTTKEPRCELTYVEMNDGKALKLKQTAAVKVFRHKDGHYVYQALNIICDTPEQVKDTLQYVEGVITVHFGFKCMEKTQKEAIQALLDVGIPVEYSTIVNSRSDVPFVAKVISSK